MNKTVIKFLLVFFAVGFLSLAATENSFAADENGITKVGKVPGTNKTLLAMQGTRSTGRQLRDKALSLEILRKPESISDLVCLPKLLGNFSGLGLAFSDLKDLVKFSPSMDQACSLLMGVQTGLGAKISTLLKVGASGLLGLNLPVLEICTSPLSVALPFTLNISPGATAGTSLEAWGCALNVNMGLYANLGVSASFGAGIPAVCMSFALPAFECTGIGDLLSGPSNKNRFIPLPLDKLGKILPGKGGGTNGGVAYTSTDEQANLAVGGDYNLLRALGMGDINPAVSAIGGVQLGVTLEAKAGIEWDSEDGLASDKGVALGFASGIMAGTGTSWKDTHQSTFSKGIAKTKMSDDERMKRGPGNLINLSLDKLANRATQSESGGAGTSIWKVSPAVGAGFNIGGIVDLMKVARKIDPTYKDKK